MSDYRIIKPGEKDLTELINLNTYYFAKTEQTNKALKIPDEMYLNYAEYITKKAISSEQIYVAKTDEKIIGYLIWEDYCKPLVEGIKGNPDVYKIIIPEIEFVEELEKDLNDKYRFNEKECAKLLQAGVIQEYQNRGIASILAEMAINDIFKKGFKYIIADCTAENSWHLLLKFGFETLTEIDYSEFEFEGRKFFSELTGKRRLVIKFL